VALRDPEILSHTLRPAERRALDAFVGSIRRRFGPDLERVILFGSRARGDVHPDSDVDVLLLLRREPGGADRDAAALAVREVEWQGDDFVSLSPTLLSVAALDELGRRERLFARDVEREGIPL